MHEDARRVPPPPIMVHATARAAAPPTIIVGRSLESDGNSRVSTPAPAIVPPAATMPRMPFDSPSSSPEEAFIPIMHRRAPAPTPIDTSAKAPPVIMPPIPPTPSDDGFTPVTPTPSPRLRGFRVGRTPQLARDGLGIGIWIPVSKFSRSRSRRAEVGHVRAGEHGDTTPLSPVSNNGDGNLDVEAQTMTAGRTRPKRRTLFGVLEGWWDLGLLERGKSLRRKV
ncbi:hypothetical protein F4779DRAFT_622559 [Xylariaceae sp. FL0662B]|nr:hypothetical protein F4779DRAFT_622559 [Xylariaceae sp. FL0662B]